MYTGTYLCRRLGEERDDDQYRSAQRPPNAERAHTADGLGTDGVNDAREDVYTPRNSGDLNASECSTRTDLGETRDVECCAMGISLSSAF